MLGAEKAALPLMVVDVMWMVVVTLPFSSMTVCVTVLFSATEPKSWLEGLAARYPSVSTATVSMPLTLGLSALPWRKWTSRVASLTVAV